MTSNGKTCPRCGRDLPQDGGLGGACPHCLVGLAFGGDDAPTAGPPGSPPSSTPRRVGPYELVRKVGEGGMGVVYEARQTEPIQRRVAVKVIKHGMDTEQVVARFEAERQALAVMDHPAVARVHDAGSTPDGRPYFAMEFVEGVPITDYCDQAELSTQQRLELFAAVCEGVQHAHQKAIIHRDLKPSNILVTTHDGRPLPKIIDFGVSKATEQTATERSLFTEHGVLVGTPAYMSPEQADPACVDIDTRTDVYSLGVVLYELLVGALPFDPGELRTAGFDAIAGKIRDSDPPRPSSRIGQRDDRSQETARRRKADPSTLQRLVQGDLDWIVMRALEKDRDRRYPTPQDLAEDVRHHLNHQPVSAGPPSAGYRARKFVRRHRIGVALVAAALVVLVAFAGTMAFQNARIARERDRANREGETAERVAGFLVNMMSDLEPPALGQSLWDDLRARVRRDAEQQGGSEEQIEARLARFDEVMQGVNPIDAALRLIDEDILDRAGNQIDADVAMDPDIALRLRETLGDTYRSLKLFDRSLPYYEAVAAARAETLGPNDLGTLRAERTVASVYLSRGDLEGAERMLQDIRTRLEQTVGTDHEATRLTIHRLAGVFEVQGRLDEADALLTANVDACRRVHGNDHISALTSLKALALLRRKQGRFDDSEAFYKEVLDGFRRTLGDDAEDTRRAVYEFGLLLAQRGRNAEAEPYLREDLENRRRLFGNDNISTLEGVLNLGAIVRRQGKYDEAEPLYREAVDGFTRVLGPDHPNTLTAISNMGVLQQNLGRFDAAIDLYAEALAGRRRVLGDDHRMTLQAMGNLGEQLRAVGRHAEAEPLLIEALATSRRALGEDHPETLDALGRLANLRMDQERYADAETMLAEAIERGKRVLGEHHPRQLVNATNIGHAQRLQGRHDEALVTFEAALASSRDSLGEDHPQTLATRSHRGGALRVLGRLDEAEVALVSTLNDATRVLGEEHPITVGATTQLAQLRMMQGRPEEARAGFERALPQLRARYPENHRKVREVTSALDALRATGGQGA